MTQRRTQRSTQPGLRHLKLTPTPHGGERSDPSRYRRSANRRLEIRPPQGEEGKGELPTTGRRYRPPTGTSRWVTKMRALRSTQPGLRYLNPTNHSTRRRGQVRAGTGVPPTGDSRPDPPRGQVRAGTMEREPPPRTRDPPKLTQRGRTEPDRATHPPAAQATQVWERPYKPSYFLPGKVEGKAVQCLVDTGCTTNLFSKRCFDKLSSVLRNQAEECDTHGVMADGTHLPFMEPFVSI